MDLEVAVHNHQPPKPQMAAATAASAAASIMHASR